MAYKTPAPDVPGYGHEYNIAKEAYQRAVAELSAQRARLLQSAGYQGSYNEEGRLADLSVDPWNPYGGYQTMLGQQATNDMLLDEERVARNLGPTGLGAQPLRQAALQYGFEGSQFGQTLQDQLGNIQRGRSYADNDWSTALAEAQLRSTRDNIAAGNFNPGNVGSGGSSGYGSGNSLSFFGGGPGGEYGLDLMGLLNEVYGGNYNQGLQSSGVSKGPPPGRIVTRGGKRFVKWKGKLIPIKKWIKNHPERAKKWGLI